MQIKQMPIRKFYGTTWSGLIDNSCKFDTSRKGKWVSINEVTDIRNDNFQAIKGKQYLYIDIGSINRDLGTIESTQIYEAEELPQRARKIVRENDILVALIRSENNGVSYVDKRYDKCIASNGFAVLKPRGVSAEYLFFCLRLPGTLEQFGLKSAGLNFPQLNLRELKKIQIPLFDKQQQENITRNIKAYLEAATKVIPIEQVLEQIFGKVINDERSIQFYVKPTNLTERWDVNFLRNKDVNQPGVSLETVLTDYRLGYTLPPATMKMQKEKNEYILLGPKQIGVGKIAPDPEQKIQLDVKDTERHVLNKHSILYVRTGSDVGRSAIIDDDHTFVANQHLIVLEVDISKVVPEYLVWLLNSEKAKSLAKNISIGSYQKNINLDDLLNIRLPIPPMGDQIEVLKQINQALDDTSLKEKKKSMDDMLNQLEYEQQRLDN